MRTVSVLMMLAGFMATGSMVNGQTIISGKAEVNNVSYISENTVQTDAFAGILANISVSVGESQNQIVENGVQ